MRRGLLIGVVALTGAAVYAGGRAVADIATRPADRVSVDAPPPPRPTATVFPLVFEENRGQGGTPERFDFLVRCRGYHAFVSSGEVVFSFDGVPLSMTTVGATPREPDLAGLRLPGKSNYLIGSDESKWLTNVPQTRGARYRDTTPGVSWTFGGRGRALEFAFDVAAGAETPQLRLDGAEAVSVEDDGDLRVEMPHGIATFSRPVAWQDGDRRVEAVWTVNGADVSVSLGAYDATRAIHVDPTVTYATYLGGSGIELPSGAATDAAGAGYICGETQSANFPVPGTPYDATLGGSIDGFVTKFTSSGTSLVYSTYIGGSSNDTIEDITVDSSGNAYLAGGSLSADYPTSPGALNSTKDTGNRSVLTKLASDGASLSFSTFLNAFSDQLNTVRLGAGGAIHVSYGLRYVSTLTSTASAVTWTHDTAASGATPISLCTDAAGNVYAAGGTSNSSFATTPGAFDRTLSGTDAYLFKLTAAGTVVYSTLLGGSSHDRALAVGVNAAGQAYVAGYAQSTNFPVTPDRFAGPPATIVQNGFLTRFLADGSGLRYSTCIPLSSGQEVCRVLSVHPTGACVVAGDATTQGLAMVSPLQAAHGGANDAFVFKFERDSTIQWSSYVGGTQNEEPYGVAMTSDGTVVLTGYTNSTNFPTVSPYQSALVGSLETFVLKVPDSLPTSLTVPSINATSLPDWTVGLPFSHQVSSTGGLGPFRWTQVSGAMPAGVTTSASTSSSVLVSGTPTETGDFSFVVGLQDSCDQVAANRPLTFHVNPAPTIDAATFTDRTIGIAIDQTLAVAGGTGALTVTLDSGALPTGVFLNGQGRVLGTPENAGDFAFTARVADTLGVSATRSYSMRVNPLPTIDAATLPDWTESIAFAYDFNAQGGTGALTWSVAAGSLPVSTPLAAATGQMVGPASAAGDYTFTLRVTDTVGATAERSFAMHVNAFPAFVTQSMPLAFAARPFSVKLEGSGGTPPLAFALDTTVGGSTFPPGLGLSNGAINGAPARADRKLPTLTYTDLRGAVARRAFAIEVAGRLDLVTKKTSEEITIGSGGTGSFKRYLELLEGTTVTMSLKLKGKGIFTSDLTLTGPDGAAIDLTAFKKVTPKSVAISKLPVAATGRYVLAIVRGPDSDGQATFAVSIAPKAAWPGTGTVGAAPAEFAFSAPPGAVATIVAKAAKGSAALPRIVAVLDEDGVDVAAGVVAKEKGGSATLKLVAPLAGGRYRVQFAGRDGSAGDIAWGVALKLPKTYDFALPDLGAGDGF